MLYQGHYKNTGQCISYGTSDEGYKLGMMGEFIQSSVLNHEAYCSLHNSLHRLFDKISFELDFVSGTR